MAMKAPMELVIDANASLPSGFTKEFVEEIEARLMKDAVYSLSIISPRPTRLSPWRKKRLYKPPFLIA